MYDDDEMCWERERRVRFAHSNGAHIMGKPEAKVMRRIQAETGLPEEEIRMYKKYRKMLSDAQGKKTHAKPEEKTYTVDYRFRFKSRVSIFIKDEKVIDELYKRCAGGLINEGYKPKNLHYATIPPTLPDIVLQTIHDQTDGRFYYEPAERIVGFQYEENLTMFLLALQVQA